MKLTHEDSAQTLGVRRAGVTVSALAMSAAGLSTYSRGSVTICDRNGLEAASCECYGIVNAQLYRCMGYGPKQVAIAQLNADRWVAPRPQSSDSPESLLRRRQFTGCLRNEEP